MGYCNLNYENLEGEAMPNKTSARRARRHAKILQQCKRTTLDQHGEVKVVPPTRPVTMGRRLSKNTRTMSDRPVPEVFGKLVNSKPKISTRGKVVMTKDEITPKLRVPSTLDAHKYK